MIGDPLERSMAKSERVEVFPHELRVGDVYRDSGGVEWIVRTQPRTYRLITDAA